MEQNSSQVDFSWLSSTGVSFEQFYSDSLEELCTCAAPPVTTAAIANCDPQQQCRRYLQQLTRAVCNQGLTQQQCEDRLSRETAGLSSDAGTTLHSLAEERRQAIRRVLLLEVLDTQPTLRDFDWNVKLNVCSDRVSTLHTPLLSLQLHTNTVTGNTGAARPVFTELTLSQLDKLIDKLQAAEQKINKTC